jgi:colicin import membrane protein
MAEATTAPAPRRAAPAPKQETSADRVAETLAAAVKAAEGLSARLAESMAAAEAMVARLSEQTKAALAARDAAVAEATERTAARIRELQAAATRAVEQAVEQTGATMASGAKAAEAAVDKAAEAAAERLAQSIRAAEETTEGFRVRMAEALAGAEQGFGQLVAQAEADRDAMLEASRRVAAWPAAGVAGTEAAGAVIEGMASAREEVSTFVASRIRQGIEAQAELMGCRTLGDLREVQGRFVRSAIEQYAAEADSLAGIGREVISKLPLGVRG